MDTEKLDVMIAAVEAGGWRGAPDFLDHRQHMAGFRAFNGSLDAALALHEALLPGWHPLVGQNVHHHYWHANVQRIGEDGLIECEGCTDQAIPARAWLLAILKAYRAKETDNG